MHSAELHWSSNDADARQAVRLQSEMVQVQNCIENSKPGVVPQTLDTSTCNQIVLSFVKLLECALSKDELLRGWKHVFIDLFA